MRKSTMVKLVFLNSVLVLTGCGGRCEEKIDEKGNKVQTNCTGGRRSGGVFIMPHGSGSGFRSTSTGTSGSRTSSTGSGSVSRGGFGSSGGAAS